MNMLSDLLAGKQAESLKDLLKLLPLDEEQKAEAAEDAEKQRIIAQRALGRSFRAWVRRSGPQGPVLPVPMVYTGKLAKLVGKAYVNKPFGQVDYVWVKYLPTDLLPKKMPVVALPHLKRFTYTRLSKEDLKATTSDPNYLGVYSFLPVKDEKYLVNVDDVKLNWLLPPSKKVTPHIDYLMTVNGKDIFIPVSRLITNSKTDSTGAEITEDVLPPYGTFLKTGQFSKARKSLEKEMALNVVRELSLKAWGLSCPVAVSEMIAPGEYYVDVHPVTGEPIRIVINESFGIATAVDADGDQCIVLKGLYGHLFVKFPLTTQIPILQQRLNPVFEEFQDFELSNLINLIGKEDRDNNAHLPQVNPNTPESRKADFIKSHQAIPVGPLTTAWYTKELWELKVQGSFALFLGKISSDPTKFANIELGAMKASSKDGVEQKHAEVLDFGLKIMDSMKFGLTSYRAISKSDDLGWLAITEFSKVTDKLLYLKDLGESFTKKGTPSNASKISEVNYKYYDGKLVKRLKQIGVLHVYDVRDDENYAHFGDNIPSVQIIWLTTTKGVPVALTDIKRNDVREGMSYCFILPPIYALGCWWTGEQYLEKYLQLVEKHVYDDELQEWVVTIDSGFDSRTWNPTTKEYTDRLFASKASDFTGSLDRQNNRSEPSTWRIMKLQSLIQKFAGAYGDVVPCQGLKPSREALHFARSAVTIDYPTTDLEEQWKIFCEANKAVELCPATKSKNERVKKYVLMKDGAARYSNKWAHSGRSAKARSQLLRLIPGSMQDYRVAVVVSSTAGQVLITGSGIKKQETEVAFLPQVINSQEEAEAFADENPNVPLEMREVQTWYGSKKKVWITLPKSSIPIGKLIDVHGNKSMPRPYGDAWTVADGKPIDLIIPHAELIGKKSLFAMTKGLMPESELIEIEYHGVKTVVLALVITARFARSGAGSENVPARWRFCRAGGCDKFNVMNACEEAGVQYRISRNDGYFKKLQKAWHDIVDLMS